MGLVCPYHLSSPGGVQRQVLEWAQRLEKLGHQVKILTVGPPVKISDKGKTIFLGHHVPLPINDDVGTLSVYLGGMEPLKELLEAQSFDLLHFHEPFMPFLPWQLLLASKTLNVATFHAFPEASIFLKALGRTAKTLILKRLAKKISNFSAVSKTALVFNRDLVKRKPWVIPNAVDLSRFGQNRKIPEFGDGRVNILYVGRLSKRKGILYLLKSARRLLGRYANLRLIVVGSGPLEEKAKKFVKKNRLQNVIFEGYVSDTNLPSYFATADIFCAPSTHGESFGIVLLEAMASGLPVVAFANAGYREILGRTPFREFLAEPEDVEGLTRCLEKLVINKSLRRNLGQAGLREVQKYSWERVGRKILDFYRKALDGAGKA